MRTTNKFEEISDPRENELKRGGSESSHKNENQNSDNRDIELQQIYRILNKHSDFNSEK